MGDSKVFKLECELRDRVNSFLTRRTKQRKTLIDAIEALKGCQFPAFVFGGALRDLILRPRRTLPRDVDIVIEQLRRPVFESLFGPHIRRKTRFGGYHLNIHGWKFDLWPLAETWAFREKLIGEINFENLTKTTFLNIEAIVVRLDSQQFRAREIYSNGFFEAVLEKKLEINLEENPFPILCVLRSLTMAARLDFTIGPRLARYILEVGRKTTPEELCELQWSHYKRTTYTPGDFYYWLLSIREQIRGGANIVRLPLRATQPELWGQDTVIPSRRKRPRFPAKRWFQWKLLNLWEC